MPNFETSDGTRLHYIEAGSGAPLLFVPGWSMPGTVWRHQVDGLGDHFRTVVLDPRGQGESERTERNQFRERRAQDVRELVVHLGLRDLTLVGWSMAVGEVLTYIDQYGTDGVRAMVLVDGVVRAPPEHRGPSHAFFRGMLRDRSNWTQLFMQMVAGPDTPPDLQSELARQSESMLAASAYSLLLEYLIDDTSELLGKCTVPLMYVHQPLMDSQASLIRERLPGARVVQFDDGGHLLFHDRSARFNALLAEFASSAAPAP